MSRKDFNEHIRVARERPLGWAVLPGTSQRAAVRVTVVCADGDDRVWVQFRASNGVGLELVPRAALLHYVAYEPTR